MYVARRRGMSSSLMTNTPIADLEARFEGAGYGTFKQALGEALVEQMAPIQARMAELAADPGELLRILNRGTERARELAALKMRQVRAATGVSLTVG